MFKDIKNINEMTLTPTNYYSTPKCDMCFRCATRNKR